MTAGGPLVTPAKGLIMVYTGDGKGKTTAALGLLLRAWGQDMTVIMLQFVKRPNSVCGEHRAAARMGIEIVAGGGGFTNRGKSTDRDRELAGALWDRARLAMNSGTYQMVILDELTYPLQYGWLSMSEVIETLRRRPLSVHVVITGRNAPREIIDLADMVTETRQLKHHLEQGIKAQPGIEY